MCSVSVIPVDVGTFVRKERVAIYARVSTVSDEQESSYELQVNELIKSVNANPSYELVSVYADKESGMDTVNRPAFNNMMALARKGGLDMIFTKSVSRFGRNAIEVPELIRELRSCGVTIFFEKENISTKDFSDEFILNILAGIAEEESRQISENLRWTFAKKMSKGLNTTVRLFGYKIIANDYIIVPSEAEVVRQIFDWYINKVSYTTMIQSLHELGIKSPSGNEYWTRCVIESILLNEKYCGDMLLGRGRELARSNKCLFNGNEKMYLVRNNHQGIISRDDFEFVQEERKRRTKYHRSNTTQTLKEESKYFYSVDIGKHFIYKVEQPKGKYSIPVLLCVKNGKRKMFQYKYVVEGITLACETTLKKYKLITEHYLFTRSIILDKINKKLSKLESTLLGEKDIDVKLSIYNEISVLKLQQCNFQNIDIALKNIRLALISLGNGFDIRILKKVFSEVLIDDNHFYLVMNPTNSPFTLSGENHTFQSIQIDAISNYKPLKLVFSVVLA